MSTLKPDLITLDIEMPEMNGLEVLAHLRNESPNVGAIVLSTLTREGGEMTIKALELGAFDFVPKPEQGSMGENKEAIKKQLAPMLKAFKRRHEIKSILKGRAASEKKEVKKSTPKREVFKRSAGDVIQRMRKLSKRIKSKAEIIVIGISTGGPNALAEMMPMLPGDINVPILVVQHMPPIFTQSLAKSLSSKCIINVREAKDGEIINPNTAFIAPGGKHMKVVASPDGRNRIIRITDDPPENSCKPSVDYLFRSVAEHYVGRATGIIMTGMGSDGTIGSKLLKDNGSFVIAQDEASCTVYGMPKEIIEAGYADVIVPLDQIANEIMTAIKGYR